MMLQLAAPVPVPAEVMSLEMLTQTYQQPGPREDEPSLSASVVAFLQNSILRGHYPPGSQLSEVPLARRLATSRTTIREALRSLSEAGLVVLHPRRGAFVATLSPR